MIDKTETIKLSLMETQFRLSKVPAGKGGFGSFPVSYGSYLTKRDKEVLNAINRKAGV